MTRQEVEQVIIANLPDNPTPKVRTVKHREVEYKILDYIDDGLSNVGVGIKGEATPSTMPAGVGFEIYNVATPGTYTNFEDSTNTAIVISQSDLDSGLVQLWGQDNVWQKNIIPLNLSAYVKIVDIVDNLISSDSQVPLSANQGRAIVEEEMPTAISFGVQNKISSIIAFGNFLGAESIEAYYSFAYLDSQGAEVTQTSSSVYRMSDFIPVVAGTDYYVMGGSATTTLSCAAYSSPLESDFVSVSPLNIAGTNAMNLFKITIPATGVTHVRICADTSICGSNFGIIKGKPGAIDFKAIAISAAKARIADNIKYSEFTVGGFISINNGLIVANASYRYTDFIPVLPGQVYLFVGNNTSVAGTAFYNEFKKYVSGTNNTNVSTLTIPADCYYMRSSSSQTNFYLTLQNYTSLSDLTYVNARLGQSVSDIFVWNDINIAPTTLDSALGNITRRMEYEAIRSVKFSGCDPNIKRTLYVLWNGYSGNFSLRISKYDTATSAWVQEFLLQDTMTNINPTTRGVLELSIVNGDEKVELIVDTTLLATYTGGGILNPLTSEPDLIFSKNCYEDPSDITNNTYVSKTFKLYPNAGLPCASFCFDDVSDNDAEVVPIFESVGLSCGFAFIGSTDKITDYGTTYKNLQQRGFAILNHSIDGNILNTTNYPTYDLALAAVMEAKQNIESAGMVVNGWVSPSSTIEPTYIPIIKAAHAYGFTVVDSGNNSHSANPCQLTRFSLQSTTLADIKTQIDTYITLNRNLVFYGHTAQFGGTYNGEVWDIAKLQSVVDYCIQKRNAGVLYVGNPDECAKYFFSL